MLSLYTIVEQCGILIFTATVIFRKNMLINMSPLAFWYDGFLITLIFTFTFDIGTPVFLLTKENTKYEFEAVAIRVGGDQDHMICHVATVLRSEAVEFGTERPLQPGGLVRWPVSMVGFCNNKLKTTTGT